MDSFNHSIFPLGVTTTDDLRRLCKTLWSWQLCENCETGKVCQSPHCPWQQSTRLEAFFQYYRETTAAYVPDFISVVPALKTHDQLLAIISDIKSRPHMKRCALTQAHFSQRALLRGDAVLPSQNDQNQAFSVAVRIMAMVYSSAQEQMDGGLLESGSVPMTWHEDTAFADFMDAAFIAHDAAMQVTNHQDLFNQSTKLAKLTAKRLKKVAKLQLVPTDNLQNHLRMDLKRNIVEVYHHTGVLKEHLLAGLNCDAHDETARSIAA